MKTNELKKGQRVLLRCGWEAILLDNARGNTRICKVFGDYTESGSVYSHDIIAYEVRDNDLLSLETQKNRCWATNIEYTPSQLKCKEFANSLFNSNIGK